MSRIGNFTETVGEPIKKKTKRNSFLYLVIWRNWILPIVLGTVFMLLVMVVFTKMKWDMFLGGQTSMVCFFIISRIYSI